MVNENKGELSFHTPDRAGLAFVSDVFYVIWIGGWWPVISEASPASGEAL